MSTRTLKSRLPTGSQRSSKQTIPPLYPGDHLSQPEFHRRYEAYQDDTRFELIGGIVYMMAPAGFEHGKSGYDITTVLGVYEAATPGVLGATGPTVILGESSEPEPDVVLLVAPDHGGQTRLKQIDNKHYIEGGPELVVEVSHSTVSMDLHSKRKDYRLGGVCEYIVICLGESTIRWFDLRRDEEVPIGDDQVLRSFIFPGLWIDTQALLDRSGSRLMKTLQRGIDSREHQEFVARLAAQHQSYLSQKRRRSPGTRNGKRGKK
jgi:Uma2 family endonuclease